MRLRLKFRSSFCQVNIGNPSAVVVQCRSALFITLRKHYLKRKDGYEYVVRIVNLSTRFARFDIMLAGGLHGIQWSGIRS